MSMTVVKPATTESQSSRATFLHSRPMTIPSSASAVVRLRLPGDEDRVPVSDNRGVRFHETGRFGLRGLFR